MGNPARLQPVGDLVKHGPASRIESIAPHASHLPYLQVIGGRFDGLQASRHEVFGFTYLQAKLQPISGECAMAQATTKSDNVPSLGKGFRYIGPSVQLQPFRVLAAVADMGDWTICRDPSSDFKRRRQGAFRRELHV